MKKVLLFCLMALFCSTAMWAQNGTKVGDIYYLFSGNEATVTCSGNASTSSSATNDYDGDVVIPRTVNYEGATYTVTAIGNYAFHGTTSSYSTITSVTIPETVTSIGTYAFRYNSALTEIVIPNSVTSIGNYSFSNCTALEKVTLSTTITTIPNYAFYQCTSLKKVTYEDAPESESVIQFSPNCTTINIYAFDECGFDGPLTIPATISQLDGANFNQCDGITSVTIEASDTPLLVRNTSSTNKGPFYQCSALETAYLYRECCNNTSLTSTSNPHNYGIFRDVYRNILGSGSSGLKTAYIGGAVTEIPRYAFYNCEKLENLIFEEDSKVEAMGTYPFYQCYALTTVTIPNTVTTFNTYTFAQCTSLESVTLSQNLETLGTYAFSGCSVLQSITIPDGVKEMGERSFQDCKVLEEIIFGENSALTTIGAYAFQNCTSLTDFTIPSGVTSISSNVWNGCTNLRTMHVLNPEPISVTSYTFFNSINSSGGFDYPFVIYVPIGSEEAYEESGWYTYGVGYSSYIGKIIFNSSIVTIDALETSLNEYYASYYHPYALNIPEGVKAYAITSFDTDGTLTMTEVTDVIPQHSAVLLERETTSDTSSYRFYIAEDDESAAISDNLLYGSQESTTTSVDGTTEGYYFYELTTNNGDNLGFYWGAEDGGAFTISANVAWLALPSAEATNISYLKLRKDGTTGIESIDATKTTYNDAIYTLQGVRISDMSQKGIYIVNGKKVLVK